MSEIKNEQITTNSKEKINHEEKTEFENLSKEEKKDFVKRLSNPDKKLNTEYEKLKNELDIADGSLITNMKELIEKYSKETKTSHLESLDLDRTELLLKIRDLSSDALFYLLLKYDTSVEKTPNFLWMKDTFEEVDKFENSLNDGQKMFLTNRKDAKVDLEGFYKAASDREAWKQPDKIIGIKK